MAYAATPAATARVRAASAKTCAFGFTDHGPVAPADRVAASLNRGAIISPEKRATEAFQVGIRIF